MRIFEFDKSTKIKTLLKDYPRGKNQSYYPEYLKRRYKEINFWAIYCLSGVGRNAAWNLGLFHWNDAFRSKLWEIK